MRKVHFSKETKRKMRAGFLWVPYAVFDDPRLNASDKIVYVALARFADNITQECFPSKKKLEEMTLLTEPTIRKALRRLQSIGYIEIDSKPGKVNYYQLNDPQKILGGKNKPDTPKKEMGLPPKNKGTNNTNINNTKSNNIAKQSFAGISSKEFNDLIDLFKEVNPTHERLFGNKTERASLERLVKKFGKDWVEKLLKVLPRIVKQPYAPRITTPYQLEKKMGELKTFIEQQRSIKNSKGKRIVFASSYKEDGI